MALIRHDSKEVQFKVVYCGPPQGGKTTNLHYIHRRLDSRWRGDLVSVATEQNRTISFDFLPVQSAKIGGYETRFQLYTVPGQQVMRESRQSVIAGADAIVFVADSTPGREQANRKSLADCLDCLRENRIDPKRLPFVFQFNKRDVDGAVDPWEMDQAMNVRTGSFLACAHTGYQVFATLDQVTQQILQGFHASSVKSGRTDLQSRTEPSPTPVTTVDSAPDFWEMPSP